MQIAIVDDRAEDREELSVCLENYMKKHQLDYTLTEFEDIFFELTGEVLHLRKPLFQQGEGFLFLLSGIERGNTVQRGFNGSCLFGEIDRLLEQTGGDMLPA